MKTIAVAPARDAAPSAGYHESVATRRPMRTPLSIVLAIIVLSLDGRHAATAGSVYGDDCPARPDSSPFDAIGCRLVVLLDSTDAATPERGRLWSLLNGASGNAGDRVFAGHGICSFGRTKFARRRLRRAKVLLDHYVARSSSPAAQAIPAEVRDLASRSSPCTGAQSACRYADTIVGLPRLRFGGGEGQR
jgi:hypothetical protein